MVPSNLPQGSSIQVRLREGSDDEERNQADEFHQHQPAHGRSWDSGPFAMEDVISPRSAGGAKDTHFGQSLPASFPSSVFFFLIIFPSVREKGRTP